MDSEYERIEALEAEIDALKDDIDKKIKKDKTLCQVAVPQSVTGDIRRGANKCCRTLKGHFGKVFALHWSGDAHYLVSASQGGQLIVWNAFTTNKLHAIELRMSWVMSCAIEQQYGRLVACGGLDNICTIYKIDDASSYNSSPSSNGAPQAMGAQDPPKGELVHELVKHDGYVSCCRFVDERHIITTSGDHNCLYWDIQRQDQDPIHFSEHNGDVMFLSLHPSDKNMFVTGSIDKTARIWDVRTPHKSVQTHYGHDGDVNSVSFFPNGNAFGTGSEDSTCRIFDMRSFGEVAKFGVPENSPVTSVDFSTSGRILFSGCEDNQAYGFDILSQRKSPSLVFAGHEKRVTCLGVSPNGDGLCTGSWDNNLKIWS